MKRNVSLWLSLALLFAGVGHAQDAAGPPTLQLNLSNPGARAMGLGGAFVSLADDATAAFTNPSGLTQLLEPEISIEGRHWVYETSYVSGGRIEGQPSGFGIDSLAGLRTDESKNTVNGFSFLSFVYPRSKWTAAIYRHEMANFESVTRTNGLFGGVSDCCQTREDDLVERTDLLIINYGLAIAYRWSENLSFGLGVQVGDGDLTIDTEGYRWDGPGFDHFFGPNSYLPERLGGAIHWEMEDTDLTFSTGFLWKKERWRIGGVYRQGPTFETNGVSIAGPANDESIPAGTVIGEGRLGLGFPDVFALGASVQPGDASLTVSLQWDRVEYSRILESIDSPGLDLTGLTLRDGDEVHLGVEYVFLNTLPLIAIRGGMWLDPAHRVGYEGDDPVPRALLQPGEDELHHTAGVGVRFSRFQIDVGVDISDEVKTAAISAIYVF